MPEKKTLLARVLITLVLFMNIQCALAFILKPDLYAPAYELSGVPGQAAIRGMGILFLMWNVPYVFAALHPIKFHWSLVQSILMQAIGWIGETLLYLSLPCGYAQLSEAVQRFMLFDGGGLIVLIIAAWLVQGIYKKSASAGA